MKKNTLRMAVIAAVLAVPALAMAAERDIAKITCTEFLSDDESMAPIIMWVDGYMSAHSDNTVISDEWMTKLGTHLGKFCSANPTKTIMEAMKAMPAE